MSRAEVICQYDNINPDSKAKIIVGLDSYELPICTIEVADERSLNLYSVTLHKGLLERDDLFTTVSKVFEESIGCNLGKFAAQTVFNNSRKTFVEFLDNLVTKIGNLDNLDQLFYLEGQSELDQTSRFVEEYAEGVTEPDRTRYSEGVTEPDITGYAEGATEVDETRFAGGGGGFRPRTPARTPARASVRDLRGGNLGMVTAGLTPAPLDLSGDLDTQTATTPFPIPHSPINVPNTGATVRDFFVPDPDLDGSLEDASLFEPQATTDVDNGISEDGAETFGSLWRRPVVDSAARGSIEDPSLLSFGGEGLDPEVRGRREFRGANSGVDLRDGSTLLTEGLGSTPAREGQSNSHVMRAVWEDLAGEEEVGLFAGITTEVRSPSPITSPGAGVKVAFEDSSRGRG